MKTLKERKEGRFCSYYGGECPYGSSQYSGSCDSCEYSPDSHDYDDKD